MPAQYTTALCHRSQGPFKSLWRCVQLSRQTLITMSNPPLVIDFSDNLHNKSWEHNKVFIVLASTYLRCQWTGESRRSAALCVCGTDQFVTKATLRSCSMTPEQHLEKRVLSTLMLQTNSRLFNEMLKLCRLIAVLVWRNVPITQFS